MKDEEPHILCSFVARFWLERESSKFQCGAAIFGHVQSDQQIHFQNLKNYLTLSNR